MRKFIINEEELIQLLASSVELCDLENAGVDNWCNYGEHIDIEGYDGYEDYVIKECLGNFKELN